MVGQSNSGDPVGSATVFARSDGGRLVDAPLAPALLEGIEGVSDLVALVDATGTLRYVNPGGAAMLGTTPDDLVGRSIAEVLHPDDLLRAAVNVERMLDDDRELPVTPALYRMKHAGGEYLRIELNAGSGLVDAGGESCILAVGRRSPDAELQEELMDLLTRGAPEDQAFELVPRFGQWRQPLLQHAVFYRAADGGPRAAGSAALLALGGLDDPVAPWRRAAVEGIEVLLSLDDARGDLRARMEASGITHLRAVPVRDPLHRAHGVVVFAQTTLIVERAGVTLEMAGYLLDLMAKILGFVLSWRCHVVELRRAADTDALTGLANRAGFWSAIDRRGWRPASPLVGMLYVDLDRFKAVNDRYGHAVGDEVLVWAADRLRTVVRPGDLIARLGGDEFVIVTHELPDAETATRIAARLVGLLAEPYVLGEGRIDVGASIGVATSPAQDTSPDELLDAADRALYRAKAAGRGRWHCETVPADRGASVRPA